MSKNKKANNATTERREPQFTTTNLKNLVINRKIKMDIKSHIKTDTIKPSYSINWFAKILTTYFIHHQIITTTDHHKKKIRVINNDVTTFNKT